MVTVSIHHDPEGCRALWERLWPRECLFDLWPVRACFAAAYGHPRDFAVAEAGGRTVGFLPLSRVAETGRYSFFPGELWQGKTWLEQNRIIAADPAVLRALLAAVEGPLHLRYLLPAGIAGPLPEAISGDGRPLVDPAPAAAAAPGGETDSPAAGAAPEPPAPGCRLRHDETGYLFHPARYGFSYERYLAEFSHRTRKKLHRELAPLEEQGVAYRCDHFPDLERLFDLNRTAFGAYSYFRDPRFLAAFRALAGWLRQEGMLRLVTLLIGGRIAAVDMGALWQGQYTVLAGGTDPGFPGAAKLINFHHLEWSCRQRIALADFLCGEFNWKDRFHLEPRPLYVIERPAEAAVESPTADRVTVPAATPTAAAEGRP